MRWLHIYSSMFGLVAILFFSVTGILLNHPSWTLGSGENAARFLFDVVIRPSSGAP